MYILEYRLVKMKKLKIETLLKYRMVFSSRNTALRGIRQILDNDPDLSITSSRMIDKTSYYGKTMLHEFYSVQPNDILVDISLSNYPYRVTY